MFNIILEKQLILKGILTPEEFESIRNDIRYEFARDNYYDELKQSEILRERMTTLRDIEDHIGKYYSREWVIRNILQLSEEEFNDMQEQMEKEKAEMPDEEEGDDANPF